MGLTNAMDGGIWCGVLVIYSAGASTSVSGMG